MKQLRSFQWLTGAVLALALTASAVSASAMEPQPDASPDQQVPATAETSAESADPTQAPFDPVTAVPSQPVLPTAQSSPEATPAESPAVQEPETTPEPRSADWLADLIGPLGAKMGQGVERLEETGDAQIPTQKELQLVETAEQLAENGDFPDTPVSGPAVAPGISTNGSSDTAAASLLSTAPGLNESERGIQLAADWRPAGIQGLDVSSHQFEVDWRAAWNQGVRFAYVKATEATTYKNPFYPQQYNGSVGVGMYRGAYHFAIPSVSSGAQQANYFVDNGGGWSADGRTLPPLLDIEYNPYPSLGNTCYGMSAAAMVSWIRDFSNTVKARTGRVPMIYSTTDWWNRCTGSNGSFSDHPLHIANYNTVGAGTLPAGWRTWNMWQYSSTGPFVGDSNVFNGSASELYEFTRRTDTFVVDTKGAIGATWLRAGGVDGSWGMPTSNETCYPTYCAQRFDRSTAFWFAATGAVRTVYTAGAIGNGWKASGELVGASSWGLPLNNEACYSNVYCDQQFERASVYYWPSQGVRTVMLNSGIGKAWTAAGKIYGADSWGIPTANETCYATYCTQAFERRTVFRASDGKITTAYTPGAIGQAWTASGTLVGADSWGMPLNEEKCTSGTCTQDFERNTAFWTAATGVHSVRTGSPIGKEWSAAKRSGKPWGATRSNQTCYPAYCTQAFADREVYSSRETGVRTVLLKEDIGKAWQGSGGIVGFQSWGIPLTDRACQPTYCTQTFERATAYSSKDGVKVVLSNTVIGRGWQASGGIIGATSWGLPLGAETCYGSYCAQDFERATTYWTARDGVSTVFLPSAIGKAWAASGRIHGAWGMSVRNQVCTGSSSCSQEFERVRVTWTKANGVRVFARKR